MATYEFNLLNERIVKNIILNHFQNRTMTLISLINKIYDADMRKKLGNQHAEVAPYVTINRISICLDTAKEHMHECQNKYNLALDQMWYNEKILSSDQRLTSIMIDLMKKCLTNIDGFLEHVYKCKTV